MSEVDVFLLVVYCCFVCVEKDTVYTFRALVVYFAEMILTSPVLIAVAIGIYMVTTTHWNVHITARSRRLLRTRRCKTVRLFVFLYPNNFFMNVYIGFRLANKELFSVLHEFHVHVLN